MHVISQLAAAGGYRGILQVETLPRCYPTLNHSISIFTATAQQLSSSLSMVTIILLSLLWIQYVCAIINSLLSVPLVCSLLIFWWTGCCFFELEITVMSQANVKYVGQVSPDFLLTCISRAASPLWAISQKRVPFTLRYWNDYVVTLSCHPYKAFRKAATNH